MTAVSGPGAAATAGRPARSPAPRLALALALNLAVLFACGLAASTLIGGGPPERLPVWAVPLANHLTMLAIALLLIALLGRLRGADFGIRLPAGGCRICLGATAGGLAIGLAAFALGQLVPGRGLPLGEQLDPFQVVLLVWGLASVAEETLYRGLVQGVLAPLADRGWHIGRQRFSLPVTAAAFLFGFFHILLLTLGVDPPAVIFIIVFAFIVGLAAGRARERSGSILPAIVWHAAANAGGSLPEFILRWV